MQVPDLVGMFSYEASGLLRELGLRSGVVTFARSRDHEAGIVIGQDPSPKSWAQKGSGVKLTVSSGRLQ